MITFPCTIAVSLYQHSDNLIHLYLTKSRGRFSFLCTSANKKYLKGGTVFIFHLWGAVFSVIHSLALAFPWLFIVQSTFHGHIGVATCGPVLRDAQWKSVWQANEGILPSSAIAFAWFVSFLAINGLEGKVMLQFVEPWLPIIQPGPLTWPHSPF